MLVNALNAYNAAAGCLLLVVVVDIVVVVVVMLKQWRRHFGQAILVQHIADARWPGLWLQVLSCSVRAWHSLISAHARNAGLRRHPDARRRSDDGLPRV